MTDAVSVLKNGGVIVYPTDTAYALGCDATNEDAVKKIFRIKGREESKTLPLIAADADMARAWAEFSGKAEELAAAHWPGPLTLVLPAKKQGLAPLAVKDGCIAIRVPDNSTARELSKALGAPLVSTSANRAGEPSCYAVEAVQQSLGDAFTLIDCVVDEGPLPQKRVSTFVKVWDNNVTVLREGAIKLSLRTK
ncbi:MAG: threonylcarbamoyl-AMP synthase [Parcubacteria group bacterium]|nr:threonylcarbamoyl-AMP synthase [Parcubacteria group bacterium]